MAPRCLATAVALALVTVPAAVAITPEQMLAANRYSAALPDPSGEYALFSATNYSFATKETATVWKRLNLGTGDIAVWASGDGIDEVVFLGSPPDGAGLLYLNGSSDAVEGGVSIYHVAEPAAGAGGATLVASLPAPLAGLKAARTAEGDVHFLVYGQAYPGNGSVYNEATAAVPASTARIYTSLFARHWDHWLTPYKNAVFGGTLKQSGASYTFDGQLTNYVTGLCNVTCTESPLDTDDEGDYALSPDGLTIAFLSKDIHLPPANHTSSQIYVVPFAASGAAAAVPINPRGGAFAARYPDAQGASSQPAFSADGARIAWTQMNGINYESDRSILYVANATAAGDGDDFGAVRLAGGWDRSASSALWAPDGATVLVAASDLGRTRLFPIPVDGAGAADDYAPRNVTGEGVAAGFWFVGNSSDTVLVSDSKIWSSRDIYTTTLAGGDPRVYYRANEVDPELAGLGPQDVTEFYYQSNTTETEQQAFVVLPEGFDSSKKYPLAFVTHGGPQGSTSNSWSTRWNLKTWADQGYVVVAPNPTASSGWGQNLTDAVQGRWGSYPYWDIVHAWKYVNETLDFVDTVNGIHAGASFGGYMSNWVQGHEMGRWFKAIVTHDGSTSSLNQYASDELWFMDHDFKGQFSAAAFQPGSPYYDWNPLLYSDAWATPHFVVHNSLDYRLPVSEGVFLFNVLQVRGVPSKFLSFPDENHLVLKRENSRVWHEEIFKWINFYSGISEEGPY